MLIKMRKTTRGSRKGIIVETFQKDDVYDLSDALELADVFVNVLKVAVLTDSEPVVEKDDEEDKEPLETKELKDMNAAELKGFAEEYGINIDGVKKVDKLREVISKALEEVEEEL